MANERELSLNIDSGKKKSNMFILEALQFEKLPDSFRGRCASVICAPLQLAAIFSTFLYSSVNEENEINISFRPSTTLTRN